MDRSLKWRTVGLLFGLLLCAGLLAPTWPGRASLPSWFPFKKAISLGLDLQGGIHIVYSIALDKGDEVLTRGGLIGKITGVQDQVVVIELQEKVRVRIPRAYIEGRWTGQVQGQPAAKPANNEAALADPSLALALETIPSFSREPE